jgi:hypothetical protein
MFLVPASSAEVGPHITLTPPIAITPARTFAGILVISGSGFTPNGHLVYFCPGDRSYRVYYWANKGGEWAALCELYGLPLGSYAVFAMDLGTGAVSNIAIFNVARGAFLETSVTATVTETEFLTMRTTVTLNVTEEATATEFVTVTTTTRNVTVTTNSTVS